MRDHNISQRRACRLVGVDPKTVRRERPPGNPDIRKEMKAVAAKRRRFGYRRIGVMLERKGMIMNHKKPQQNAFIESFNGSLRDELLNEEMFESLDDARRKLALWRYDYNQVRPHSSLGNQTPAEARRALEQFEGSAPGALAQTDDDQYENQTRRLSL